MTKTTKATRTAKVSRAALAKVPEAEMSQAEYDAMIDAEDDDFDEATEQELSSAEMFRIGQESQSEPYQVSEEEAVMDLQTLPDIASIDLGSMKTKSARIRYLRSLGYERGAVADLLGIRYQHVFNVEKLEPKRAAREDTPKDVILRTDIVTGDQGLDNPTTLKDLGVG